LLHKDANVMVKNSGVVRRSRIRQCKKFNKRSESWSDWQNRFLGA